MDEALAARGRPAADRIRGIAGAMATVGSDRVRGGFARGAPPARERRRCTTGCPGGSSIGSAPAVTAVIEDGVAAGEFVAQDPRQSAAFVLACFASLHDLVGGPEDLPEPTVGG